MYTRASGAHDGAERSGASELPLHRAEEETRGTRKDLSGQKGEGRGGEAGGGGSRRRAMTLVGNVSNYVRAIIPRAFPLRPTIAHPARRYYIVAKRSLSLSLFFFSLANRSNYLDGKLSKLCARGKISVRSKL